MKKIWLTSDGVNSAWMTPPLYLDTDNLLWWLKCMPEGSVELRQYLTGHVIEFKNDEDYLAFKLKFGTAKNFAEMIDMPGPEEEIRIIIK